MPRKRALVTLTEKRLRGRPSLYKEEDAPELARRACLLGATNQGLADFFDVSTKTIDHWIATKPEFAQAVYDGRQVADTKVADSLYQRATGYSHPAVKIMTRAIGEGQSVIEEVPYTERYAPDATSMIFWLKNRRPDLWRDKQEIDNPGAGNTYINNDNRKQTVVINAAEASKDYKALLGR